MGQNRHGTVTGYSVDRCRCRACRRAWAGYMASYKKRRRDGRPPGVDRELAQAEREVARLLDVPDGLAQVPVRLSPLALQILAHLQRGTGELRSEIVERLLREHAAGDLVASG